MSMINYASREINCKLVYYGPGPGRQDHQPGARVQQGGARLTRQDDLAGHRDRAHPVLRLPAGGPRHHPRVQGQVPPLHRARAGLLQRLPQADPQGRGRRGLRGRQPDRADGRQHRGDAEPLREHDAARVRPHQDSLCHPVQQARPPQRRAHRRAAGGAQSGLAGDRSGQAAGDCPIRTTTPSFSSARRTGSGSSGRPTSRRSR